MSTIPAGKRSWKCPECGQEVLLSVAQLDPIACEACVKKMKGGGGSTGIPDITNVATAPLGMWGALPETTKLGIVVAALVVGLVIGYLVGSNAAPTAPAVHHTSSRAKDPEPAEDTRDDSAPEQDAEVRPDPPGPGYKWVRGRKHKDGTYGKGHWAKDPRADDSKRSE